MITYIHGIRNRQTIHMMLQNVQSLSVVRDMGVLVDQELTFKQHVVSYF